MNEILENVVEKLRGEFDDVILGVSEFRGDVTVLVQRNRITDITRFLRDLSNCPFNLIEDICGVDRFERKERFEVVYHLFSLEKKVRICLKVRIDEAEPHVPTVTGVFPGANWHERETFDMYGIVFDGHPDLRRVYMPEDYEHFPMRKDFPLLGIPGSIKLPRH